MTCILTSCLTVTPGSSRASFTQHTDPGPPPVWCPCVLPPALPSWGWLCSKTLVSLLFMWLEEVSKWTTGVQG